MSIGHPLKKLLNLYGQHDKRFESINLAKASIYMDRTDYVMHESWDGCFDIYQPWTNQALSKWTTKTNNRKLNIQLSISKTRTHKNRLFWNLRCPFVSRLTNNYKKKQHPSPNHEVSSNWGKSIIFGRLLVRVLAEKMVNDRQVGLSLPLEDWQLYPEIHLHETREQHA